MKQVTSKARAIVSGWIKYMQDGDKIVRRGNTITIYGGDCELESITF